jgi:hypothetical protein
VSNERPHAGTSVRGNVSGTGIAIGAGASANVSQISTTGDPTVAAALELLRSQLASLDVHDDETADRVALAETRLDRLEEAASADGERDHGRMRKLLAGVVDALGGLTSVAGGVAALEAALAPLLR